MIRSSLLLCLVLALPCAAQDRKPTAHIDIGGGPSGGGNYSNNGGLFGRIGGRVPLGPDIDFGIDAGLFGSLVSTECVATLGTCPPDFPTVKSLTLALIFPITGRYNYHQVTGSVGAGDFSFYGQRDFARFGMELGAEMILFRRTHSMYTIGARMDLITQTPRGQTWMMPVTAGIRF